MKNKQLILGLVIFLLGSFVAAETVLLYTDSPAEGEGSAEVQGYFEDGVMEVFFDSGHIIFNGDYRSAEEEREATELFGDRPSFRLAKRSGAGLVLEVRFTYSDDQEEKTPRSVRYRFIDVQKEKDISSGSIDIAQVPREDTSKDTVIVQRMGALVGRRVLKDY